MTISRAQAMILMEPKLAVIWHEEWPQQSTEWTSYLNQRSNGGKATLTDYKMTDFGVMRFKGEGENISYDDPIFGNTVEYTPVRYALGYKVTQEMLDHEQYGQVDKLERGLIKSANDLQETKAALFFNNGFGTTDDDGFEATGFDGLQTFSTSHTRLDGGATFRNRPSTDVDFGVTGYTNMLIDFDKLKDDRGRPLFLRPTVVYVNPEDRFTAKEVIESELKPGTANNELNAIRNETTYKVLHYLTDTDAWFARAQKHDANFVWDVKPRSGMEEDFDAEVIKRKCVQGFAVGHGEARGWWGTSGG
jgi:hypothetical protein